MRQLVVEDERVAVVMDFAETQVWTGGVSAEVKAVFDITEWRGRRGQGSRRRQEWRARGGGEKEGQMKGGRGWHRAVVCPGTAAGRHSTPAFSPVPVDPQADCHSEHTHSHKMQSCVYLDFAYMRHQRLWVCCVFFFFNTWPSQDGLLFCTLCMKQSF